MVVESKANGRDVIQKSHTDLNSYTSQYIAIMPKLNMENDER